MASKTAAAKTRMSNEKIVTKIAELEARLAALEVGLSQNENQPSQSSSTRDQQLATISDRQLIAVRNETKEMIMVAAKVISSEVHNKVMQTVEREIIPKINAATEWYDYKTQDGDEVVNAYQRAVAAEIVGDGRQMITDGRNDKYVLSKDVQVMFNDDF